MPLGFGEIFFGVTEGGGRVSVVRVRYSSVEMEF